MVGGKDLYKNRFQDDSERVRDSWMMRLENRQKRTMKQT